MFQPTIDNMLPRKYGQHGPGRILVQNASAGRAQIIPDFVPELTCWLYMIGMRYERTLNTVNHLPKRHSDRYLRGVAEHCSDFCEIIQRLINIVNDKFARHEWWVSWSDVCDQFGIDERTKAYGNFMLDDLQIDGMGI